MKVEVKNNDVMTAYRKLKKAVFREKILKDYLAHVAYEKPSVKRRRKHKEALREHQRRAREDAEERD